MRMKDDEWMTIINNQFNFHLSVLSKAVLRGMMKAKQVELLIFPPLLVYW